MKIITKIIGAFLMLFATISNAQDQFSLTIDEIGTQDTGTSSQVYFTVTQELTLNCAYNSIFITGSDSFRKEALSILLSAQATGTDLHKIAYEKETDGWCKLSIISKK